MSLVSRHFRSDARLQRCLVEDAAHVTEGETGPHVLLIQRALAALDHAPIPAAEMAARIYGTGTAAAVLAFKRRRRIVNRAYQSEADNIVGRMTIAALDRGMAERERSGAPLTPPPVITHPRSPDPRPVPPDRAQPEPMAPDDDFVGPVSSWPDDLKATIRQSNALRTTSNNYLAPIIPWGRGRQTLADLSALLAVSPETPRLRNVYARLSRFRLWGEVRAIRQVFQGTGAHGFFCDVHDHNRFLVAMSALSRPRGALETAAMRSAFCRDYFNVHGPRDSFREMVDWGAGLHICITQPARRTSEPCDIHIDEYQTGSDCVGGYCIPRAMDARTIAHMISVGPWLADEAKRAVGARLRSLGVPVPW